MSQCGYFMEINTGQKSEIKILGADTWYFKAIEVEDTSSCNVTAKSFINALRFKSSKDAAAYVSKNFVKNIDFNELEDFFINVEFYKNLLKVNYKKLPPNCFTNSMLVKSKNNDHSIIHLHMVKEPDDISLWKIYGIEKE